MEVIKYDMINSIGMELFRKNNSTFLKDQLSPIMARIFKAANMPNVQNTDNDFYMKSGIIHNRVFYIYSDELNKKDPDKIYDIVHFNNEQCMWIYSKNIINKIDTDPVNTISSLYYGLINTLIPNRFMYQTFTNTENFIVSKVMTLHLILFLNETYGALDLDECKKELKQDLSRSYTEDSVNDFIEDICENYNNKSYFTGREYLDSYLLLKEKLLIISV